MENDYRDTYSKVCRVKEVEDFEECNKLLKQHWILLNTYTYCVDSYTNQHVNIYVLGDVNPFRKF